MSITIGVDYHKKTSTYCVLNEQGKRVYRSTLPNDKDAINQFFAKYPEPKRLAMEATRNWSLYYDFIKEQVDEFQLGHPKKMKALTESETKNDKHDAQVIAELTHMGFLPRAHVSSPYIRDVRDIVRYRGKLVDHKRTIKNQVHALIDRNVWLEDRPKRFKDLFCQRGMDWLKIVQLQPKQRFILDDLLMSYTQTNELIHRVEGYLSTFVDEFTLMPYLRTVPGFLRGGINAVVVLAEISDLNRFHKAKGLVRYAGLIPREHSSAGKVAHGRLVKDANMHLRTAFIECTLAAIRVDKGMKAYYKSVKERAGSSSAIIATARKLASAVFHVLKEQRPYRPHLFQQPLVAACHPSSDC